MIGVRTTSWLVESVILVKEVFIINLNLLHVDGNDWSWNSLLVIRFCRLLTQAD